VLINNAKPVDFDSAILWFEFTDLDYYRARLTGAVAGVGWN